MRSPTRTTRFPTRRLPRLREADNALRFLLAATFLATTFCASSTRRSSIVKPRRDVAVQEAERFLKELMQPNGNIREMVEAWL